VKPLDSLQAPMNQIINAEKTEHLWDSLG
jgi:hypothetical protein